MNRHFYFHKMEMLQRETLLNQGKTLNNMHFYMKMKSVSRIFQLINESLTYPPNIKLGFETATYPPFDLVS